MASDGRDDELTTSPELGEDVTPEMQALEEAAYERFQDVCELAMGLYARTISEQDNTFTSDRQAHFKEQAHIALEAARAFFEALDEMEIESPLEE